MRGEGTEGEEKDGEIRDGIVAYPDLIGSEIRVGCRLRPVG